MLLADAHSHHHPRWNARQIHTSESRKGLEVMASLGLGFYTSANWLTLHTFVKGAAFSLPMVTAGLLLANKRSRTHFDPFLGRTKTLLKVENRTRVPKTALLDGPAADKASNLLLSLIEANLSRVPVLSYDCSRFSWRVLFFQDPSMWIDAEADGTLFLSKDIVTLLSKQELAVLLATQCVHVIARHKEECASLISFTNHSAAIVAWYYALFVPVLHSYPVDMAAWFLGYQALAFVFFQRKFRSLCLEADRLGIAMAAAVGAKPEDAISLMRKLMQARKQLPLTKRFRSQCYYQRRIEALEGDLQLKVEET